MRARIATGTPIPLGEAVYILPVFDELRASPRFATVLRRFNLDVARLTKPDGGRSQQPRRFDSGAV